MCRGGRIPPFAGDFPWWYVCPLLGKQMETKFPDLDLANFVIALPDIEFGIATFLALKEILAAEPIISTF
jgi:hypothetical protein